MAFIIRPKPSKFNVYVRFSLLVLLRSDCLVLVSCDFEFAPGVEGLCHISELSDGYVKTVDSVCKIGDSIPVKLLSIDDQGRFKLSRKAALAEMGASDKKGAAPDKK